MSGDDVSDDVDGSDVGDSDVGGCEEGGWVVGASVDGAGLEGTPGVDDGEPDVGEELPGLGCAARPTPVVGGAERRRVVGVPLRALDDAGCSDPDVDAGGDPVAEGVGVAMAASRRLCDLLDFASAFFPPPPPLRIPLPRTNAPTNRPTASVTSKRSTHRSRRRRSARVAGCLGPVGCIVSVGGRGPVHALPGRSSLPRSPDSIRGCSVSRRTRPGGASCPRRSTASSPGDAPRPPRSGARPTGGGGR